MIPCNPVTSAQLMDLTNHVSNLDQIIANKDSAIENKDLQIRR